MITATSISHRTLKFAKAKKEKVWLVMYDKLNGTELVLHLYNPRVVDNLLQQKNIYRAFYLEQVYNRTKGKQEHFIAFNVKTRKVLFEANNATDFNNLVDYYNFYYFDDEHAKNMIFLATKFQK